MPERRVTAGMQAVRSPYNSRQRRGVVRGSITAAKFADSQNIPVRQTPISNFYLRAASFYFGSNSQLKRARERSLSYQSPLRVWKYRRPIPDANHRITTRGHVR
jgi:hypothetical protein